MTRPGFALSTRTTLLAGAASLLAAQAPPPSAVVEVTATKFPEDPARVPASMTVLTARDLADRGATDLRSALAMVAGLSIAPGGDAGPASAVPEFWGLKEFDAFLLVVDGVPWGGAYNPALATLSLEGVERIEVQRGAAPVMYGATSFVGVIHILRSVPRDQQGTARLSLGIQNTAGFGAAFRLPSLLGAESSLVADHDQQGYPDARTGFRRTHVLWQNRLHLFDGLFRADLEATAVDQQPASPFPRVGKALTTLVPLDANHNPGGAHLDQRRTTFTLGYDRALGPVTLWSSTLSASRAHQDTLRGFLTDVVATSPNAHGFRQQVDLTDLTFDSHLTWTPGAGLKVVTGLDHLHGQGQGRGGDFDYSARLDGANPIGGGDLPSQAAVRIDSQRDLTGAYAYAQWEPRPRLVLEGGLRLIQARETRRTAAQEGAGPVEAGADARTTTRLVGSAGAVYSLWQSGEDRIGLFTGARSTFKPAAVDFGLDSEARILQPETARSLEAGVRADLLSRRLNLEVSLFRMTFENLVVPQTAAGGPVLANAGTERFQGVEGSATWRLRPDLAARLAYSYHDARFQDYRKDFGDGTFTQLAGKRLEMSPYHLGSLGLAYAPARGLTASAEWHYTGAVLLNQRNTAPSPGYGTLDAGVGWRDRAWELRVSGQNLTDRRPPVSESELGDAQYYLLPARQVTARLTWRF